jgi:hypothetical protein
VGQRLQVGCWVCSVGGVGGGRASFLELVGPGLLAVAVLDFGNSVLCHLAIKLAEMGFL